MSSDLSSELKRRAKSARNLGMGGRLRSLVTRVDGMGSGGVGRWEWPSSSLWRVNRGGGREKDITEGAKREPP